MRNGNSTKSKLLAFSFAALMGVQAASAQTETAPSVANADSTAARLDQVEERLSILGKKMKPWGALSISGYVQVEAKYEQSKDEIAFNVRRGRVKTSYSNEWGAAVLQLDVTEKGVGIKDAYLMAKIPKFDYIMLQGGVFDRPFGYEISYSSSKRETMERSRIFRTLFPNERELGAKLRFTGKKGTALGNFWLDAGIFCGNGIAAEKSSTYGDMDKDFIGHFGYSQKFKNWSVGAGLSYYYGNVYAGDYIIGQDPVTKADIIQDATVKRWDDNAGTWATAEGKQAHRQYFGVDAQFEFKTIIGKTKIFGEFLIGTQPGLEASSTSHSGSGYFDGEAKFSGGEEAYDIYERNFMGGYVYLTQSIVNDKNTLVFKYDNYDPNYKVSGVDCTNEGDIMYHTFSVGYIYSPISNLRLMAQMDFVWNEITALKGYTYNKPDNVVTLRVQYKF